MKQRSIGMCILLTIVTCGIYGLYWFVCITDDTNEMAGKMTWQEAVWRFF